MSNQFMPRKPISRIRSDRYREVGENLIQKGCAELNIKLPKDWREIPLYILNDILKEKANNNDLYRQAIESDLELLYL